VKNLLVLVGELGARRAYLNVNRDEALKRYCVENNDLARDKVMVQEFYFDDEFGTYDAWPLETGDYKSRRKRDWVQQ
jgi:hypothetical protein